MLIGIKINRLLPNCSKYVSITIRPSRFFSRTYILFFLCMHYDTNYFLHNLSALVILLIKYDCHKTTLILSWSDNGAVRGRRSDLRILDEGADKFLCMRMGRNVAYMLQNFTFFCNLANFVSVFSHMGATSAHIYSELFLNFLTHVFENCSQEGPRLNGLFENCSQEGPRLNGLNNYSVQKKGLIKTAVVNIKYYSSRSFMAHVNVNVVLDKAACHKKH